MRKHNTKFAQRWSRDTGDRANFPQTMAHKFVNDKEAHFNANPLLSKLFTRMGIDVDAMFVSHMGRKLSRIEGYGLGNATTAAA